MDINQRMFQLMSEKNVKMVDLAKKLDVNKTVISAWKNRGTNPPVEYIVQICELLEVSIEKLITGKESKELTEEEREVIESYRAATPAMQAAARKLLDLPETKPEKSSILETG